ncbi:MAG: tetratricopeptide repeat protein [Anaeromassilibacillus sp.]
MTGKPDFDKAFQWEKKAADNRYVPAMEGLAWLYRAGLGCERDLEKAKYWYEQAAEYGYVGAYSPLAATCETLLLDDAVKWWEKAADLNDSYACYHLGKLYKDGYGKQKPNYQKAADLFRRASEPEHNQVEAQYELGQMYYLGYGFVGRDFKEALRWFQSAAETGQVDSQYNTAYQYQYGLGVEQNVDAAIGVWRKRQHMDMHCPKWMWRIFMPAYILRRDMRKRGIGMNRPASRIVSRRIESWAIYISGWV